MGFRKRQTIFYLLLAFFVVPTALFFFQDAGVMLVSEPAPINKITPFTAVNDSTNSSRIYTYPLNPAPGDFLIVEAGPLSSDSSAELQFDFPGVVSNLYRADKLLFAIIAISPDTEPGDYLLSLLVDDAQNQVKDLIGATVAIAEKEFSTSYFTVPPERTEGWTAARLAEDREKIRQARQVTEPGPLWLQRFISPLEGRVSSEYGAIRVINNNPPRRHNGIDIAADEGVEIIAPNRGIVRLAESLLSGGSTVIIEHGIGLSSTYMHLHSITVAEGSVVERGEVIGTVGMSGYATGPHLHWEVNIGQTAVNPEQLLDNDLLWISPAYVDEILKLTQ